MEGTAIRPRGWFIYSSLIESRIVRTISLAAGKRDIPADLILRRGGSCRN